MGQTHVGLIFVLRCTICLRFLCGSFSFFLSQNFLPPTPRDSGRTMDLAYEACRAPNEDAPEAQTEARTVITLRSGRDDCERPVPKSSVAMSRLLSVALGADRHAAHVTLDLSGSVLRWVADYMDHHRDGEPDVVDFPLRSKRMADVCADPWDACFVDQVCAVDVALAAHYLDMQVLLHLCCAKLATDLWQPNMVFKKGRIDQNSDQHEADY